MTQVYWYELQTVTGDTFDSALLDPAGQPRESFCAITGQQIAASLVSQQPSTLLQPFSLTRFDHA